LIAGRPLRKLPFPNRTEARVAEQQRTEATRARVVELYDAYRAGDMPTVMARMAADIAWHSLGDAPLPWSGTWRGHEGVGGYFTALFGICRIVAYDIERIMADGDWASVLATVRVRFHADGSECSYVKVDILRLRDGHIAEFREFYDTASIERDLGRTNTATSG
jgi:ketosteroid isomerase-like protein